MPSANHQQHLYDKLRGVISLFQGFSLEQIVNYAEKLVRDNRALSTEGNLEGYTKLTEELVAYANRFQRTETWGSVDQNNFGGWLYEAIDYIDELNLTPTDPEKVKKLKVNIFKAFIEKSIKLGLYGSRSQIKEADLPLYDKAQIELTKASPSFAQMYEIDFSNNLYKLP